MGATGSSETLNLCQTTRRRILEDSIIVKLDLIVAVPVEALKAVFLNSWAAARYGALLSIIPGRERPEQNTVCYKISLVQ